MILMVTLMMMMMIASRVVGFPPFFSFTPSTDKQRRKTSPPFTPGNLMKRNMHVGT
jgi:hypothetical protein